MNCPRCDRHAEVKDSRPLLDGSIRRRRICSGCGQRFTTYERRDEGAVFDIPGAQPEVKADAEALIDLFKDLAQAERRAVIALTCHFTEAKALRAAA